MPKTLRIGPLCQYDLKRRLGHEMSIPKLAAGTIPFCRLRRESVASRQHRLMLTLCQSSLYPLEILGVFTQAQLRLDMRGVQTGYDPPPKKMDSELRRRQVL
jgi:hypothetical protein